MIGRSASTFSLAPLGLPGTVQMTMPSLVTPATGLERAAMGVLLREVDIMRCCSPLASFTRSGRTASGVRSRGEKPVPPVVMHSEIRRELDHRSKHDRMAGSSSGTTSRSTTLKFSVDSNSSARRGPVLSVSLSFDEVSLTGIHGTKGWMDDLSASL